MDQEAQTKGRWWRSRGVLVIVTLLVVLAAVAGAWRWQRHQEATCWLNMASTQGAWCMWALDESHRTQGGETTPTLQDLDRYIRGGYRARMCPAGGRHTLSASPHGDDDHYVTCTVHGDLLKYPRNGRKHPRNGRSRFPGRRQTMSSD